MAGYRWELPMHLFDLLFYPSMGRLAFSENSGDLEFLQAFDAMISKRLQGTRPSA